MKSSQRFWADLSLLLVAVVWGSTFVVVKWAIEDLPPFPFLAIRFCLAFLSLLPFLWHYKTYISKGTLLRGFILGVFLFSGYAWQTVGLQYTTASNAGFITGLSVVFVPAFVSLTTKKLPRLSLLTGILCALIGLAFLSLGDHFRLNMGDLMVLVCAVSFALHIFFVGRFAPRTNATVLACVQILTVSILSTFFSFVTPQPAMHFSTNAWLGLLITAVPATSLAFFVQTKMQQFTTPSHTALIFSMEPVFAALAGFVFMDELLTPRGLLGAGLVLGGMLLAEFTGTENETQLV